MVPHAKGTVLQGLVDDYAGYNMNIPDQYRMDQFERSYEKMDEGEGDMPHQLRDHDATHDHGARVRPEDGYPFTHNLMVD